MLGNIEKILGHPFTGGPYADVKPVEEQITLAMNQIIDNPPAPIVDGVLHRFPTGPHGTDDAGWYIFFPDKPIAGAFGDWRSGQVLTFCQDIGRELTPLERQQQNRRIAEAKQQRLENEELKHEHAATRAQEIWSDRGAADKDHPYLERKGISPNGARVSGDGRLLVPLYHPEKMEIASIQFISPDGNKQYIKGGKTKGCFWFIGDLNDAQNIFIAEGYATAATIYEETLTPVIVAYSANNLPLVAETVRKQHPTANIVIVADNDSSGVGEAKATQAATKCGGTVIMPPTEGDVNDFRVGGGDVKNLLLPKKEEWLVSASDWLTQPAPIKWLVKGWIQDNALVMLHGPSGSGKTFCALDIALSISTGKEQWCSQKIKNGNVVYLAGEGNHGLRKRVAAWMQHHKESTNQLFVSQYPIDLNEPAGTANAIRHIKALEKPPRLIVIDTLHRFMAGDENSAQDAKTMIDACGSMQREFDCTVMLVHHTGVSGEAQKRARGSSAWKGALENEISVRPEGDGLIFEPLKIKDAEQLPAKTFVMDKVFIDGWYDEDGEQENSVVLHEGKPTENKKEDRKLNAHIVNLKKAWIGSGCDVVSDYPYISRSSLIKFFVDVKGVSSSTAEKNLKPSIENGFANMLLDAGIITKHLNGYSIIDDQISSVLLLKRT